MVSGERGEIVRLTEWMKIDGASKSSLVLAAASYRTLLLMNSLRQKTLKSSVKTQQVATKYEKLTAFRWQEGMEAV